MYQKIWEMLRQRLGINDTKKILNHIEADLHTNKLLLGKLLTKSHRSLANVTSLNEVEFKVYSQFEEDGIIQYLLQLLDIQEKSFIEIGVENYQEANTRFLLENNNWSGLIIDCNSNWIEQIKESQLYWQYNLNALSAFVNRENSNKLISDVGYSGEIGLLSIDVDGIDYWIWQSLEVIDPQIVVIEYNSVFGDKRTITVPYKKDFNRTTAHYSNLYFGASLPALNSLAKTKGYIFIGCNSAGNNAFFVHKKYSKLSSIKRLSQNAHYIESKFRESRNQSRKLNYKTGKERLELIKSLPVINVISNKKEKL
jgi:hypothetical protein